MRLAHIENGIVTNISLGEIEATQQAYPNQIIVETSEGQIGWFYGDGIFTPPNEKVEEPKTKITRLAFRNRFSLEEKTLLYTTAKTNIQIQIYLDDVNAATYIDLSRPDTRFGVITLENIGIIAPGRAAQILDTPAQTHELYL